MLVARKCDPGSNFWFSSKCEPLYPLESPRMPEVDPSSARPVWQENYYTFSLADDQNLLSNVLEQGPSSNGTFISHSQHVSKPVLDQQTLMRRPNQTTQPGPILDSRILWKSGAKVNSNRSSNSPRTLIHPDMSALPHPSIGMSPIHSRSNPLAESTRVIKHNEDRSETEVKDEDEELEEDDDMIDGELEDGAITKNDAQRRAERRKMKRFR